MLCVCVCSYFWVDGEGLVRLANTEQVIDDFFHGKVQPFLYDTPDNQSIITLSDISENTELMNTYYASRKWPFVYLVSMIHLLLTLRNDQYLPLTIPTHH